jgi:hypothetical protein
MKTMRLLAVLFTGLLLGSASAAAAGAKTYQVTGPVLEVTDTMITVQKGKETWQIDRTKDTTVTGDLKVGGKVTIMYRMTAESIEGKPGKEAKGDAKAPAAAAPKAGEPAKAAAPAKK